MMRINKLKIYILYVFAANFIVYIIYISVCNTNLTKIQFYTDTKNVSTSIETQSLPNGKLKKNIFFLKTHKTASSTVQNILMRFGLRHSLNFMLPKKNNYLGYLNPITLNDVDNQSIPPEKKFNIFTHHSRYRRHTNQFLYPDTIRVTILRNPSEQFESVFNFYNFQKLFKVSFRQFVKSLPHTNVYKISNKRKIQGRNQMSRDLGLENSHYQNRTEILKFIRFIDEEFDLVMIQEYMEASLVLLAHLMGWPLHYVSFISMNIRKNTTKSEMSETDRHNVLQYNYADHLLYQYFLSKFQKHVLEYGFERLVTDVQTLYSINVELRKRCILKENNLGFYHTISYVLKDYSDWECVHSTKEELKFTSELREEQTARLELIKRLENLIKVRSRER